MGRAPGLNRSEATSVVSRRVGRLVTEQTLRYWERLGLIHPTPARCRGPAHPAIYGAGDLLAGELLATLRLEGTSLQKLRRGLNSLERNLPGILDRPGLWRLAVTPAGDVKRAGSEREMLKTTRRPGQLVHLLDVGEIACEARAVLEGRPTA